ncbi:MAG: DUF2461 domain-containing protein [Deltaproteobacteria bacterium]|nr:DUF2461 domain-containing protein [Deltaproteobacteria bacterium]
MSFQGFQEGSTKFLRELSFHNSKEWFEDHRAEYQEHWLEAGKAFVTAAGDGIREFAPRVSSSPKVNGSIFRLHRDVRFSNDKTPYKTHLDMMFWQGDDKKKAASGFLFRLKQDHVEMAVGSIGFDKDRLAHFREVLQEKANAKELLDVEKELRGFKYDLLGEHYKRLPRGLNAEVLDDDQQRLLRYNACWTTYQTPLPSNIATADFLDDVLLVWRRMLPLHQWMVKNLS